MHPVARIVLALTLAAAAAGTALGQPSGGRGDRRDWSAGRMSDEERQRLREDLQRQPVDPRRYAGESGRDERPGRYAEWQRMSPEQREGIRRDMRDYNRDFDRRRR
jgi:uncharacterized membrane protein